VQLWWTYSERVGRFGVAAVLVTIVLRDMALACSACMYFMFFIVHFFVSLLVSVSACSYSRLLSAVLFAAPAACGRDVR
jgi:hypothetical protein